MPPQEVPRVAAPALHVDGATEDDGVVGIEALHLAGRLALDCEVGAAQGGGDGLGDLFYSDNAGYVYVAYSSGGGFGSPALIGAGGWKCTHIEEGGFCLAGYTVFTAGDVNGDGRADMVAGNGFVYLSTGGGFTNGNWGGAVNFTDGGEYAAFIADANGDGKADLKWSGGRAGS